MKAAQTYLKGKSVFIVSLVVIAITAVTVYVTGIDYHRSVGDNLYRSLAIIATALFLFMTYGLYKGVGLIDNFPAFRDFKSGDILSHSPHGPDFPMITAGEGIGGLLVSIILWIGMSVLLVVLLVVLEAVFWFSLFVIMTLLYWVFFRALKLVFSKSAQTKGHLGLSALYALGYTLLYTGWIFGVVYLVEVLQ